MTGATLYSLRRDPSLGLEDGDGGEDGDDLDAGGSRYTEAGKVGADVACRQAVTVCRARPLLLPDSVHRIDVLLQESYGSKRAPRVTRQRNVSIMFLDPAPGAATATL